jgi:hypothetical protein
LVTLVGGSRSGISDILALLLLLLLALLAPNFINIQKLDGNQITLESTVSVLATADKDISIKEAILSGDISIATVLLVDTEDAGDELAVSQKSRERSLRKIGCEKGLALLLLLLTTHLTSVLGALETHELLTVHLGGLQSLQLVQLHWVELLSVHLGHHHLVGHLHDLRLARVKLETSHAGDGLAHGSARSVTRLETLVLSSVARLILTLSLSTPVAFKVARSAASVAASAALKFVTLSVQAATATTSAINSHTLAATMTTTPTAGRALSNRDIKGTLRRGLVLIARGRRGGE